MNEGKESEAVGKISCVWLSFSLSLSEMILSIKKYG